MQYLYFSTIFNAIMCIDRRVELLVFQEEEQNNFTELLLGGLPGMKES